MGYDISDDLVADFSPIIRVYKDGTVERIFGSPFDPPSTRDQTTGVSSKDLKISEKVSARIYLPDITESSHEKLPILVYFHGGGFCTESAFSVFHHRYVNVLVSEARAVTVSVEYRLAPEHPLPAAFDDCWNALQWVASHFVDNSGSNFKEPWLINHGNFDKFYIAGDSCGGTITHNMAMRAGKESLNGDLKISGAILSHPYFMGSDSIYDCDSQRKEKKEMYAGLWFLSFSSAPGGIDNPMINPLADDAPSLSGLGCSKLLVTVAEKDVLRQKAVLYIEALKKSDWKGELQVIDTQGEDHTFHVHDLDTEIARIHIKDMASFIS